MMSISTDGPDTLPPSVRLAIRVPATFRPLPLESSPTVDESAWSAEQKESMRLLRNTWRGSGIIFLGECRRNIPGTDEPSTAALSIGCASIPGAERVRSARDLLGLVGSGSSTAGGGFRAVEHAAGPCVVSLGASVLALSAPGLPENIRKAVDGGVRCLEALA